jgi:hypothetical protein
MKGSEDQRLVGHATDHLRGHRPCGRDADEGVGTAQRVLERARLGDPREPRLVRVHAVGASLVDDAAAVGHQDVLGTHA